MKIREIKEILDAVIFAGEDKLDDEIIYGYSCDLMSDVLAYIKNNDLLLTGLVHPQVIRTAEMLDIKAIMIVRGKTPGDDIVEMAKDRGIVIMATRHSLFTASGLLYTNGLQGEEIGHYENSI